MLRTHTRWHWGHDGERAALYDDEGYVTEPPIICETNDWLGFDRDPSARLIALAPEMAEALRRWEMALIIERQVRDGAIRRDRGMMTLEDAFAGARAILDRLDGGSHD